MDQIFGKFSGQLGQYLDLDATIIAVGVALLVIILTLIVFRFTSSAGQRKSIVMVGSSDAGKTLLFTQLVCQRHVNTMTSMKENAATIAMNNKKSLELVDLPGFERLVMKYWDDYKQRARGILFVVDSFQFMTNIRDVAELLYNILADEVVNKHRTPLLVACNKNDIAKAKSAKVIQSQLEKEINTIRDTRLASLDSTSGDVGSKILLGRRDKEFQFSDLKSTVEFVDCSALNERENDLDSIHKWMNKLA